MYDFLLFVHVLFAFGLFAAVTMFWTLIITTRPGAMSITPAAAMLFGRVGAIVVGISSLGAMIFGVWLAIYLDEYELWDGWIIGSLILWAIATGVGQRSGVYFQRAAAPGADVVSLRRTGTYLQLAANASLLLILILMIFKPGA